MLSCRLKTDFRGQILNLFTMGFSTRKISTSSSFWHDFKRECKCEMFCLKDQSGFCIINATKETYQLWRRILAFVSHFEHCNSCQFQKLFDSFGHISLRDEKTIGQPCFRLCDMKLLCSDRLIEFVVSQGEGERQREKFKIPCIAALYCNHTHPDLSFELNFYCYGLLLTNATFTLLRFCFLPFLLIKTQPVPIAPFLFPSIFIDKNAARSHCSVFVSIHFY